MKQAELNCSVRPSTGTTRPTIANSALLGNQNPARKPLSVRALAIQTLSTNKEC